MGFSSTEIRPKGDWRISAKRDNGSPEDVDADASLSSLSLNLLNPRAVSPDSGKVLIVGAGWYGCHAAMVLTRLGVPFDMVDSTNTIMSESSIKNQNRLHLGFHYPRAYRTRDECVTGHEKFMSTYENLTVGVSKNLYLVAKDSLIDYQTYCNIFAYEGTAFKDVPTSQMAGMPFPWMSDLYDGFMLTEERMIDCVAAQAFFRYKLRGRLLPGYRPADLSISSAGAFCGEIKYRVALDCTYGQLVSEPNVQYELSCSWVYKFKKSMDHIFGFTVMDGPFFSIFPYKPKESLFTLTHVSWTPLLTSTSIEDIREAMESKGTLDVVERHRAKTVAHVLQSIPDFEEYFECRGHFLSIKCKSSLRDDDRSLRVREANNCVSFCGGKITGIFSMQRHLEHMAQSGQFKADAAAKRVAQQFIKGAGAGIGDEKKVFELTASATAASGAGLAATLSRECRA
jgi:hypothetical protein